MNNDSVLPIFCENGSLLGTGFVIQTKQNSSLVLTCKHVIDSHENLKSHDLPLTLVKKGSQLDDSANIDLALLEIDHIITPLELSENPTPSSNVQVIGYSKFDKKQNSIKREMIENINIKTDLSIETRGEKQEFIKLSPSEEINAGYSGSPVICGKTNKVIGIITHKQGAQNYALSVNEIQKFHQVRTTADIHTYQKNKIKDIDDQKYYHVLTKLESELSKSLTTLKNTSAQWVEPRICNQAESDSSDKGSDICSGKVKLAT
jgi:hypothetical protein